MPLEGLPVVDLRRALSGPFCSVILADRQRRHCGRVEEIDHPEIGGLRRVASLIRMDALGARTCYRPPPLPGEHTREGLIKCGSTPKPIEALAVAGVVQQHT